MPCWTAKSGGETYFLGIQSDIGGEWYPPQLNHQVLVEGTVAKGPRICGGIVLKPIKTSVLPEVDKSCNTILPAVAARAGDIEQARQLPTDIAETLIGTGVFKLCVPLSLHGYEAHPLVLLQAIEAALKSKLAEAGLHAEVHGREKKAYSIWRKIENRRISLEQLSDIYGFRVVLDSVDECYRALGSGFRRRR